MYDQQATIKTRSRGFKFIKWILFWMISVRGLISYVTRHMKVNSIGNLGTYTCSISISVEEEAANETMFWCHRIWFVFNNWMEARKIVCRSYDADCVRSLLCVKYRRHRPRCEHIHCVVLDTTLIGLTVLIGYRIKTDGLPLCNCWCCTFECFFD